MATGPRLNATGARPTKAQARSQEVPQEGAYPIVRHLAGSRVPFSSAYVASLTGQKSSEVDEALKDAFEWGWINQVGDTRPQLWIGRL